MANYLNRSTDGGSPTSQAELQDRSAHNPKAGTHWHPTKLWCTASASQLDTPCWLMLGHGGLSLVALVMVAPGGSWWRMVGYGGESIRNRSTLGPHPAIWRSASQADSVELIAVAAINSWISCHDRPMSRNPEKPMAATKKKTAAYNTSKNRTTTPNSRYPTKQTNKHRESEGCSQLAFLFIWCSVLVDHTIRLIGLVTQPFHDWKWKTTILSMILQVSGSLLFDDHDMFPSVCVWTHAQMCLYTNTYLYTYTFIYSYL